MDVDETGLIQRVGGLPHGERRIVAIAGPPAAGKSTVVGRIADALNQKRPNRAAILPMDGFHYDDAVLTWMGRLDFKGAPDTFDVSGLRHTLERLKDRKETVAVPVFDRDLEVSRGSARLISPEVDLILVEGNYLLVEESPWDQLAPLYDLTVMIRVSVEELTKRLTERWEGFGKDQQGVRHKLDEVDLPNGRYVLRNSAVADILFVQG